MSLSADLQEKIENAVSELWTEKAWNTPVDGGSGAPARKLFRPDMVEERLRRAGKAGTTTVGNNAVGRNTTGVPDQVRTISVTESPKKIQDRTYSLVSVTFLRNPIDAAFAGVRIWLTGYQANPGRVLVADGFDSPLSFLVESTGESVVVAVQAVGTTAAADLDAAPTATVLLDGVNSTPPSPTVTQNLVAIPNGYQFTFTMEGALLADVIDGYWVYRSSSSSTPTPPTSRFQYVLQSTSSSGSDGFVFQDGAVEVGATYYYWVSAVNKSGLESSLTSAQSGATTAGGANPVEGSYVIAPASGASCLSSTDLGAGAANISIAAFTLHCAQFPSGVSYNAGAAALTVDDTSTAIANSTLYAVYCDDVGLVGGTQTYKCTKNKKTLVQVAGRILIDTITTAANGGGGTSGGGDGGGGAGFCWSPESQVLTQCGPVPISSLMVGDRVRTQRGTWRPVKAILVHRYDGPLLAVPGVGRVTPGHPLADGDAWKPASALFSEAASYTGTVYNLTVEAEEFDEQSYEMVNGLVAHNKVLPPP
jgi:hypothetical protein